MSLDPAKMSSLKDKIANQPAIASIETDVTEGVDKVEVSEEGVVKKGRRLNK